MSQSIASIIGDLHNPDPEHIQDAIEAVKRYLFTVAKQRGFTNQSFAGRPDPLPSATQFLALVDGLLAYSALKWPTATVPLHAMRDMEIRWTTENPAPKSEAPVVSGFVVLPSCPPSPAQWLQAAGTADGALNDLRTVVIGDGDPLPPWGDDSGLARVPRGLLRFLHGKDSASINDDLCKVVWGKSETEVSDGSINQAIHLANKFLKDRYPKCLSKRSDGAARRVVIRWVQG